MTLLQNKKLGLRLINFRKKQGLTQKQLQERLAFPGGMLSRIESGKVNPNKETVIKIANELQLNQREIDYLLGTSFELVSKTEEELAQKTVKQHFASKKVTTYLLDDRWRFIDISAGFLKLFNWKKADFKKIQHKTIAQTIVDTTFPLIHVLARNEYQHLLETHLPYYYAQTYFMNDDPSFIETEESIKKNPFAKKIWNQVKENKPVHFLPNKERRITFQIKNEQGDYEDIPMFFSREPLFNFPRFEVMEYVGVK